MTQSSRLSRGALIARAKRRWRIKQEKSLAEFLAPLFADRTAQLRAERVDRRKTVTPGVRTAGVENRAAVDEVAGVALVRMHRRIEGRAPATVDDADRGLGVAARGNRPDDF